MSLSNSRYRQQQPLCSGFHFIVAFIPAGEATLEGFRATRQTLVILFPRKETQFNLLVLSKFTLPLGLPAQVGGWMV